VREMVVYSRRGCHLCEVMLEQLEPMCRGRAQLSVRDVDTRPEWAVSYGEKVPVLCCDNEELCHFELDRSRVESILAQAG
jgi:hypothetical protein